MAVVEKLWNCDRNRQRADEDSTLHAFLGVHAVQSVIINFCHRLAKKEKNGKVIVCAVMRRLVHLIFSVLKSGRPFDPTFGVKTA